MDSKEIRVACPLCEARIVVDGRTHKVITAAPKLETDPSGRPRVGLSDWRAAVARIADRSAAAEQQLSAALDKEQSRSQELDALFAARSEKLQATDKGCQIEGPGGGHGSVTADLGPGSPFWVEALEAAHLATLEDRCTARGARSLPHPCNTCQRFGHSLALVSASLSSLHASPFTSLSEWNAALRSLPLNPSASSASLVPTEQGTEKELALALIQAGYNFAGFEAVFARSLEALDEPPDDGLKLRALLRDQADQFVALLPQAEWAAQTEDRAQLAAEFSAERCRLVVLEEGSRIHAAAAWFALGEVQHFELLCALSAERGLHWEQRLLRACLQKGKARNCRWAVVSAQATGNGNRAWLAEGFVLAYHRALFQR